jgi:hypothetical protein
MEVQKIAVGVVILLTVFSLGCMEENHGLKHIWTKNFEGIVLDVDTSDSGITVVSTASKLANGQTYGSDTLQAFDVNGKLLWSKNLVAYKVKLSEDGERVFVYDNAKVYLFDMNGKELWRISFDEIGSMKNRGGVLYIRNNTFIVVDFEGRKAYYLNGSGFLVRTEEFEKFPKNVASKYGYNAKFEENNLYLLETFKDDEKLWTQPTTPSISCFAIPYDQDYFVAGVLAPKWSFTECGRISLMDFKGNLKGNYTECKPLTAFLLNNFNIYCVGISDNGKYIAASPVSEVKLLEVIEE